MRKFYSFVLAALMLPSVSFAQTMTEENPILDQWGYRLEKDVNFNAGTVNGKEIVPADALQFGEDEDYKINSYAPTKVTNEGLEWLSVHTMGSNIFLEQGTGLRSSKNERWIAIKDLRVGQILAFDISNPDTTQFVVNSNACNGNTGWADTFVDPLIVEPISGSIHELQEAVEEGSADTYRYFKVINEGVMYAKFNGKTANTIYRFQIWADKNDAEAVTPPTLKIVGVSGDSRKLEFKPGESTFGSAVYTYYSLDGSDPIFLKETEEVDYYEYVYGEDEEGKQVVVDSTAVYKKVLDADAVAEYETYGDLLFNPEDGSIDVYGSNDEDGDGIVVVKAASVSETGAVSKIVTVNVQIGEIQLNAPTLTLQGFSGVERLYSIDWSNNTLVGEEFSIAYEGDGGALYGEAVVGDVIAVKENVKVTVHVEGYTDGVLEQDAELAGIDMKRKAAVTEDEEGNPVHDWDFARLTDEQKAIIQGTVVESCYLIVEEDSLVYSAAEYEAGVAADGTDLSGATANYAPSCWWWDGGNKRATLNVDSDTIVDASTLHDCNENGYGYVEDFADVFHGISVSCPPNNKNNSCIFIYIDRDDLGVYFMARPTLTFPRESAAAGEYVLIYQGQGGSNYTNTRWPGIYEVPAGELLSVTLPNNGIHVFYIDVYTYDGLPEDEYDENQEVAIKGNKAVTSIVGYYGINGAKLSAPQKGINIVKYADGTTMKILVK